MSETLPRPIEPQDIRLGQRVRFVDTYDTDTVLGEFTVTKREGPTLFDSHNVPYHSTYVRRTWTLLADAPTPVRPVGSHWRDPETGAEYVLDDDGDYLRYRMGSDRLGPNVLDIPEYTARLVPVPPTFDPAALWPHAPAFARDCIAHSDGRSCSRGAGHYGMHAAYVRADTPPVYVWGDPR